MFTKSLLKPGMLVQLKDDTICILAYTPTDSDLSICWNDNSGRCLSLKDYEDNLTYRQVAYKDGNELRKYDIMVIYNVGSFIEPFSMNSSTRTVLWRRDSVNVFSYNEKTKAGLIEFLMNACGSVGRIIVDSCYYNSKIVIRSDNVKLVIPNTEFPNLAPDCEMEISFISNGEVLQ